CDCSAKERCRSSLERKSESDREKAEEHEPDAEHDGAAESLPVARKAHGPFGPVQGQRDVAKPDRNEVQRNRERALLHASSSIRRASSTSASEIAPVRCVVSTTL